MSTYTAQALAQQLAGIQPEAKVNHEAGNPNDVVEPMQSALNVPDAGPDNAAEANAQVTLESFITPGLDIG